MRILSARVPLPSSAVTQADPENALKVVYARGEFSDEEYRRRLAVLREK
jgi:hypothetical protein